VIIVTAPIFLWPAPSFEHDAKVFVAAPILFHRTQFCTLLIFRCRHHFLFLFELAIVFGVDAAPGVCDDSENLFRRCTGGKRSV
jgi:hypothetical protein